MLTRTLRLYPHLPAKRVVRFLIIISTIYGFWNLNDVYSYKPFPRGALKALEMSLLGHLGLWLSTIQAKGVYRFFIAILLIPSALGVYLFMWHQNDATLFFGLVGLAWLLKKVLRGW